MPGPARAAASGWPGECLVWVAMQSFALRRLWIGLNYAKLLSGCACGCAHLDRHTQAYREYLLARGNAADYVRSCEAAVVRLSIWMKQANKRLNDLGEELLSEFLEHHLPGCQCAKSARHPSTVRAALGHLLVMLRACNVIAPKPLDMTAVGQELRRYDQYMDQVRGLAPKTREGALRLVEALNGCTHATKPRV